MIWDLVKVGDIYQRKDASGRYNYWIVYDKRTSYFKTFHYSTFFSEIGIVDVTKKIFFDEDYNWQTEVHKANTKVFNRYKKKIIKAVFEYGIR